MTRDRNYSHRRVVKRLQWQRRRARFAARGLSARGKRLVYRKHDDLGEVRGAVRTQLRNRKYKLARSERRALARLTPKERAWRELRATMNIVLPENSSGYSQLRNA